MTTVNPTAAVRQTSSAYGLVGWYALAVLIFITLFKFVDRQVFILLAEPIRVELGLSDFQIGMLQGFGIALFGALAGYPIGWLADKYDRRVVLAGCLSVWSMAVVACGLAPTFALLFLFSAMVGAGEAGLIPIVYSLIPELVREKHRQLANSIYTVVTQFAYGVAMVVCTAILTAVIALKPSMPEFLAQFEDWRLTFFGAALPAPFLIALLATIRYKRKHRGAPASPAAKSSDAEPATETATVLQHLKLHRRTMGSFYLGIGLAAFGFVSIMNWVPVIVMRRHDVSAVYAGGATGTATMIATGVGFVLGTIMLRYMRPRFGVRVPIVALWTATLSASITSFLLIFTVSAMQIFVLQAVQFAFIIGAFMVYPTAIQDISPIHLRARLIAILTIVRMVLIAGSPLVVGALSDAIGATRDGLLYSAAGTATVSLAIAAGLLWWCGRHYRVTVEANMDQRGAIG